MSACFLSLTSTSLAIALANHLWQSTVIGAVIALLTLTLQNNHANIRYWLWLTASMKFLIPFSLLMALGGSFANLRHASPQQIAHGSFLTIAQISQPFTDSSAFDSKLRPIAPANATSISGHLAFLWNRWDQNHPLSTALVLLVAVWFIGFVVLVTRWTIIWRRISAAIHLSTPLHEGREFEILQRIKRLTGVRPNIELRLLPVSMEPGIFGLFRPVLLWPQAITGQLEDAQLEAVLTHEICHVRRKDNLTATLHMVVKALFWFHPLVWWLETQLIKERENACDEEVLRLCKQPAAYAQSILKVCEFCIESPLPCTSGVSGADLKHRIVQIMSERTSLSLSFAKMLLLTVTALLIVSVPILLGQVNTAPVSQAFEVASIRLNKSDAPPYSNFPLNSGDMYAKVGGLFSARNFPLITYIAFAYDMKGNQLHSLEPQLPHWSMTDGYDIEAHALGNPTKEQMRGMMRSLLADRFKFKVHYEKREEQVLALVLAKAGKTGSQLQPHPADAPCQKDYEGLPPVANGILQKFPGGFPPICKGILGFQNGATNQSGLAGRNVSIGFMADMFSQRVDRGRPMIDATGLTGTFDFLMKFAPESQGAAVPQDPNAPDFEQALREQLGLKLRSQKSLLDVITVDRIERPTEN